MEKEEAMVKPTEPVKKATVKSLPAIVEAPEYLLQFFEYGHLPPHMQDTSKIFHEAAHKVIASCPRNPERTMALRRLLEAKDCGVRAMIFKQ